MNPTALLQRIRPARVSHSASTALLESLENRLFLAAQAYDWNSVTIKANGFIDGIVYSDAAPNVFYIHTDMGGAYRWDQSASKWMPLNDWSRWDDWSSQNLGVETLAADPTDANRVYMACGTYMSPTAITRSTDGGRTWLRTDVSGINSNGNGSARNAGQRMVVDPNSPNILFYGTREDGLWKSTDYGASWGNVSSFPSVGETSGNFEDTGIVWVQFDKSSATPGNPTQTIYAGVVNVDAGETRIYRSTDGGASWSALPGGQPTTANYFPQRAALTPDGSVLYLTYGYSTTYPGPYGITGGFVYKVTNPAGASPTWTAVSPVSAGYGFSAVEIDPTNPGTVYVGELNNYNPADRLWRSTNAGASWTALTPNSNRDNSSAPYANSLSVHWLGDFQIDPYNNNIGMFTTGFGIYRTTNLTSGNPTWTFFNEGFEQSAVLELASPNTGSVYLLSAIGDRDGFRHYDFAVSPNIGRHGQNNNRMMGTCRDIDVAFNDANYVVRTGDTSPYAQYSNDNGVTWNWFSTYSGSTGAGSIAISADGTKAVWDPGGTNRVRYSTRSGTSWGSWTTPASNQPANNAVVVADLVASQTFYAYVSTTVSRSTDGGANWTVMSSAAPSSATWIRAVPGQAGHLLMSRGSSGLWRSTNGGATWNQLAAGVVTTANVVGVGAGPTSGVYPCIYVGGTVGGVTGFFRSDDQGATWTTISDLSHQFGWVTVIQGDPRVYGRLYVGCNGRGVQYADIHTTPANLPSAWSTQDIGSPGSSGAAGESAGAWDIVGGGAGIAGTSDQFRFAYKTLAGDGTITARVMGLSSASPANNLAKAGVMFRNSLSSNSANALLATTPGSVNGAMFQRRSTTGGNTSTTSLTQGIWPPYWVRLTRAGNQFTAYVSPNGSNWTQVGSPQTIAMNTTVYVGLAVTASDNNQLNISQFQNVSAVSTDTIPPTVTASSYWYQTAPNTLSFTFSEDVSASLSTSDLSVTRLGGGTVTPSGMTYNSSTNTATFTLPTPLADGNYRATLAAAGVTDAAGNPLPADYDLDFFFLGGDANRDRIVDITDLGILASNWQLSPRDFTQGDFNYNGTVEISDLGILATNWQASVAAPGAPAGPARPIVLGGATSTTTTSIAVAAIDRQADPSDLDVLTGRVRARGRFSARRTSLIDTLQPLAN